MIVPCNVSREFNSITNATLTFESKSGEVFVASLRKGHTMTRICGSGWESFMEQKSLSEGSLVHFDLNGPVAKVYLAYVDLSPSTRFDEVWESTVINRSMKLDDDEFANLLDIIPVDNMFLGVPFVHRLTKTNIEKFVMKIPLKVVSSLHTAADGLAGIRLGTGSISTAAYKTCRDGRVEF